jgi:hypothetical protein
MKTQEECGAIPLHFCNLGARWGWMTKATLCQIYSREMNPVLSLQVARWPHGRSGWMLNISPPQEFDPRILQPVAS